MNHRLRLSLLFTLLLATAPLAAAPVYRPTVIDQHALKAPATEEESVESLAKYLVQPARSDGEKVRAIYRWVTDRIRYDVDSFLSGKTGDNSTRAALDNRRVVCEGYSNLVRDLCKAAGIKVVKVTGRAKGVGYVPGARGAQFNHAWNAVKIDDQWCLLDATWGAGDVNGKMFVKRFRE